MSQTVIAVILGAELRAWWNRLTKSHPGRSLVLAIALLVAIVFFGGAVFAGGIAAARFLPGARDSMLAGAFSALSVLMLVLGFPTVIGNFFVGRDLLQLVLAPIRSLDIFVARALLAVRANVLLAGVVLAFVFGVGVGSGASAVFYLVTLVLLFLQVLAVTAVQVILMAVVLRFVPARIARDVAAAVAGITGAALYLAWNVTLRSSVGRRGPPDVSGLVRFANQIDWLPSAWAGHALSSIVDGSAGTAIAWSALFLVLSVALTLVAAALYGRTLLAGLGLLGSTPALWTRTRRPRGVRGARPESLGAASPALAIARKDWLGYRRDIRRLSRVLPGLFFLFAYGFVLVRPARGVSPFWTDVFLTAFMSMFLAMAIAPAAIPGERRGFQLLRLAPVRSWEVLRAKVLLTLSPVVALTTAISTIVAATTGNGPLEVAQIALLAIWLGFGSVSIGAAAGAIDPHFESVDDRRAVGVAGTFAAIGGELAFGLLSVGAFALLQFSVDPPSFLPSSNVIGPLLALIAIPLAAGAAALVFGMLWVAAARLSHFEGAIGSAAA